MHWAICGVLLAASTFSQTDLQKARDAQDRGALERLAADLAAQAGQRNGDAAAQYRAALAQSYLAEVAIEQRDKNAARSAAEAGMRAAKRATELAAGEAEYHRLLGTLCGQAIRDAFSGLKYGKCALEEVNRAIELNPKAAVNYVSRGVGDYYLPPAFGGGVDRAIPDFEKAIQLDPKLAEAHLWLGIALRKAGRNAEARKAFERSLQLNPNRAWAKQQLDKTPAR
jgi:tetratricopeptide (TPR) repeat protein